MMTFGQDLDAMIEARRAMEWESLNEEPVMDTDAVITAMDEALDSLKDVCRKLGDAANTAEGFPIEDRIWSIFKDLETYQIDIEMLSKKIGKEVKSA